MKKKKSKKPMNKYAYKAEQHLIVASMLDEMVKALFSLLSDAEVLSQEQKFEIMDILNMIRDQVNDQIKSASVEKIKERISG